MLLLWLPSSELLTKSGLPTHATHRSSLPSPEPRPSAVRHDSQIAADGGFGRMPEDDDSSGDDEIADFHGEPHHDPEASDNGFGNDFDDFESGGEAEDFGEFDDGFEEPSADPKPTRPEAPPIWKSPYVSNSEYKTFPFQTHFCA